MSGADRQQLPKHILKDRDRNGNVRYYYRRPGHKMIRIRAEPGTPAFDELYNTYRTASAEAYPVDDKSAVYFFRQGRKIKIGFSTNPMSRLRTLQIGAHVRIEFYYSTPGGRDLERKLHKEFAQFRVAGEWFLFAPEIRDWIDQDERRRRTYLKQMASGLRGMRPISVARCDTIPKTGKNS